MNFLDDKPKYNERTMTQTIVFIVGLLLVSFLFAMFKADDRIRLHELLIGLIVFSTWLITLIWIGHARK